MRIKVFSLFFILCIGGCTSSQKPSKNVKRDVAFDSSLILPWSKAHKDKSTAKSPALYEFRKGNKTLWYMASRHSNTIDSLAFKIIKWTFDNQNIDIAILEGFGKHLGFNPESISKEVKKGIVNGVYRSGEAAYAIEIVESMKIPFIGGEPSDAFTLKKVLEAGFTAYDLLGFEFVRRVPQLKRSKQLENRSLKSHFDGYISYRIKAYQLEKFSFSFDEFKKWYREKQNKEFNQDSGQRGEAAPIDDGPYFTQKVSVVATRARDEHVLSTVSEMLDKYDNVFIAYGSSHYRLQHEALKAEFGNPIDITPDFR